VVFCLHKQDEAADINEFQSGLWNGGKGFLLRCKTNCSLVNRRKVDVKTPMMPIAALIFFLAPAFSTVLYMGVHWRISAKQ